MFDIADLSRRLERNLVSTELRQYLQVYSYPLRKTGRFSFIFEDVAQGKLIFFRLLDLLSFKNV